MRNFRSITTLILLNLALINVAFAANIPPNCPDPKVIKEQKWVGEIKCDNDYCLYAMGGLDDGHFSFNTNFFWHFYIEYKITSLDDIDFAKSKMVSTIDSLVYQSGPTQGGTPGHWDRWDSSKDTDENFNYTCLYTNNQGAQAKAVVTNVRIHPNDGWYSSDQGDPWS